MTDGRRDPGAPIIVSAYDLCAALYEHVNRFPRAQRTLLGRLILDEALRMLAAKLAHPGAVVLITSGAFRQAFFDVTGERLYRDGYLLVAYSGFSSEGIALEPGPSDRPGLPGRWLWWRLRLTRAGGSARSLEMAMNKTTTLRLLRSHKAHLAREFGVTDLALFGSTVRDDADKDRRRILAAVAGQKWPAPRSRAGRTSKLVVQQPV